MSASVLFLKEKTKDTAALEHYRQLTAKAAAGFDIELLAAYREHEVTEGAAVKGVVLLRFANMQEAKSWYGSAAYQAASQHRKKGVEWQVTFVEGIQP